MTKQYAFQWNGTPEDIGPIQIKRYLPNRYADAVGAFVLLDYLPPQHPNEAEPSATQAHPHRGICTLSYILEGAVTHLDSLGNHVRLQAGSIQWMHAGNGILHDEEIHPDPSTGRYEMLQFWINLPSSEKAKSPSYKAIDQEQIPSIEDPKQGVRIKLLLGHWGQLESPIPSYLGEKLIHVQIAPGGTFHIATEAQEEYAIFIREAGLQVQGEIFEAQTFLEFDRNAGAIVIENREKYPIHFFLFGGTRYEEGIVADGPFVMNTPKEIAEAHRDYLLGKYGSLPS